MRSLLRRYGRWAIWLVVWLVVGTAVAQTPSNPITDDEVNAVARQLYCPTCENTPLDVCPTQTCADWREEIRTQLTEGRSEREIKQYFAARFGDKVLAEPPQRGFHLLVWLLPVLAIAVGGFFFQRYLRAIHRPVEPATPPPSQPIAQDDYVARIERELQERG